LLIIKNPQELFPALEKRVRELHSYSVPEIIAVPLVAAAPAISAGFRNRLRQVRRRKKTTLGPSGNSPRAASSTVEAATIF